MKTPVFPILSAVVLLAGCINLPAPNRNPRAWVPSLPEDVPAVAVGERSLQQGDEVTIMLHTPSFANPMPIKDIVDSFGNVTLPNLGEVKVGGLTTSEAERKIQSDYVDGGIYLKMDVTVICVTMAQENERTVSVTGCVMKRGSFPYKDGMTLREAIILAGDLSDFANGAVLLTRNGVTKSYNLNRIKSGREEDPPVRPRDIIEAKERMF